MSEPIESTASIALPFAIQTDVVQRYNLAWKEDNKRIVYVELKDYEEINHVLSDENLFEFR